MLETRRLQIADVLEIVPRRFGDDRGFFSETYSLQRFRDVGVSREWVQDNQSLSRQQYTLRGLHYQEAPFAQTKLVRVLKGRILDVAVDIRRNSPTFGQWVSLELSSERFNQILVPQGFAHGFLTLEPDTEVFYKVDAPYSAQHDRSIHWNDPDIAVDWGLGRNEPMLSDKDRAAPLLRDAAPSFIFEQG